MRVMTLQLDGLHCRHCVKSVENALFELPTMKQVKVDLATQTVVIESEESVETLTDTILDIGFEVKSVQ